jgi:hypothetical protein
VAFCNDNTVDEPLPTGFTEAIVLPGDGVPEQGEGGVCATN